MTTITDKLAAALCELRTARKALAEYDATRFALELAHDRLSDALEDVDASNDDVRDAALSICDALNAHWANETPQQIRK